MNSVSKIKVIIGYVLLLAVMFFSLFFVNKEVDNLLLSDDLDLQWTDSLSQLLREKDANTIRILRTLSELNTGFLIPADNLDSIIGKNDSVIPQQRIKRRVISHRDTMMTQPHKKGFFRRLGEVFVPPKQDTAIKVNSTLEYVTDTVIETYHAANDSLRERLRLMAEQQKEANLAAQRRQRNLQKIDNLLTARIDTLLKGYEEETLARARADAEHQQSVRQRSANILGGIAVGAVLLAALFLIIIGRDITRSNRYRRELEESRRRAEELLATREKLMLAITHDFKAPLGSIMGYADLLSRLTVDERQRFYLNNMKTSSEHLLKLVVDLLDFHRLDLHKVDINRVSFHPSRLLEEIMVSFRPLTDAKELTLQCEIAPELEGTYICDPLRLKQIINNLLSNAVKFTERGGIKLSARYEERMLVIVVADTGRGMAPSDRERIFQEFTRLPGAQGKEGFGLGLSIVRMLVQLLEGSIEVDSELEKGSTFTLRVPVFPVRSDEIAEQETAGLPVLPPSLNKVLMIDDDRIQLELTAAMLSQSGIASVSCLQIDELLDALRTDVFDVLLTDVQMPAISGFDLLKLLRASNIPHAQTIPVIAVTARSDMQRQEFVEHGFSGCLHKPFMVQELLQELGMLVKTEIASADEAVPEETPSYDFSAITAFAGDDSEAAASILRSFVSENQLHLDRLRQALTTRDMDELVAVAHKMLPVFTLLRASSLAALLKELESMRGTAFSDEAGDKARKIIEEVEEILTLAK